jgi:hypothetical protein
MLVYRSNHVNDMLDISRPLITLGSFDDLLLQQRLVLV